MPEPAVLPPAEAAPPALVEARYALPELLREVEYERQHSVLGLELIDQGEIKTIFKARAGRRAARRAGPRKA